MHQHPLQIAATALADSLNHRVVAAAIAEWDRQERVCPACHFQENQGVFREALLQYTVWRIRYSRLHGGSMNDAKASWGGIENTYFQMLRASSKLTQYWPCPDCLARYNPTGRKKQRYGNRRRNRRCHT